MKKSLLFLMTAILAFSAACSPKEGNGSSNGGGNTTLTGDVEVWSAPATEKVLQNLLTGYDHFKGEAKVDVYAARGEYESTQLIITSPEDKIEGINLKTAQLTSGENTFPAENIEVFFEKYLDVKKNYDNNGAPLGKYPDALVPMQNIIDCKENVMEAGSNQGLYVRFNVPVDQPAGVYTGNFTLEYGGKTQTVAARLEVADLTVSQETHARSHFISEWQYRLGELDSTQAMLDKYIEAGLEYRISPAGVVIDDSFADEDIEYYVDKAAEWMKNPKCTHVSIPLSFRSQTVIVDGESLTASAPDVEKMQKVLSAFIEKSFEDNYDYIKKLGSHLVDEPQLNNALNRTKVTVTLFRQGLKQAADTLAAETRENAELQATLVESIRNIRAVITASYAPEYADYIDTWCPTVDYYDSEAQREVYKDQEEKWWYTCISPRAPFPTYHIEDTLLSARALSWMQAEYDVVGNLFWATNVYANYNGSVYENIEDFYEGDASRFSQVNGDGFLFYPGKAYGIDGPIGSMRLEAIRDGLEEYEVLYELKQNYSEVSKQISMELNANNAIRNLTTDLYAGTRVNTTSAAFDAARRALYSMAMMSNSNANVSIIDYEDDNYGTVNYRVFVADGYELYNGETLVTGGDTVNGGKIYTVSTKLENATNQVEFTAKKGTESYTFTKNLGGKVQVYNADKFATSFAADMSKVTASLVDASSVVSGEAGKLVKLDLAAAEEIQRIKFTHEAISGLSKNTRKVILRIYCDGLPADGVEFAFTVKTEKGKYLNELAQATLKNGWNEIEVSMAGLDFDKNGSIRYALFRFNDTVAKTIYLKDVVVYDK